MSKTKKIKRKTTSFDIVYRVVTAVMATLIYPLFYFLNLLYIEVAHKGIADLIGSITQNKNPNLEITYQHISLSKLGELFGLVKDFVGEDTSISVDILKNSLYRPALVAVGFLAAALVLGLVILGFAVFSNKVKVITGLSVAGFVCTVVSFFCFSEGFAAPIISGETSLPALFGNADSGILQLVFSLVGEVTAFNLEGAFFAVMFLMLGIAVWSISVMVVNISDEKEKKAKKLARENKQ